MTVVRPIGRIGRHWTKGICATAAAVLTAGGIGVGTARADDSVPGIEVAVDVQIEVSSDVQTAVSVSADAGFTTMNAGASTSAVDTTAVVEAATGGEAPSATALAVPARPVARHAAPRAREHPRKSRPRAGPQVRGRPPPQGAASAPSPQRLAALARAAPDRSSGTPAAPGRTRPAAPAPRAPFSPSTPAPDDPGISWSGHGGGQGAFPAFFAAVLAAVFALASPFVLRRVIWWAAPSPTRIALPPWRPG